MRKNTLFALMLLTASTLSCVAQKNEASLSLGTTFVSDLNDNNVAIPLFCIQGQGCATGASQSFKTSHGFAIEESFAHRVFSLGPTAALYVEVPLVEITNQNLKGIINGVINGVPTSGIPTSASMSSLFFTPGIKLKLLPKLSIAPFVSVGGGLAHYSSQGNSTNRGALAYGGGLQIKTPLPQLALQVEARDFYSADSVPGFPFNNSHIHNVLVSGGAVFHF